MFYCVNYNKRYRTVPVIGFVQTCRGHSVDRCRSLFLASTLYIFNAEETGLFFRVQSNEVVALNCKTRGRGKI